MTKGRFLLGWAMLGVTVALGETRAFADGIDPSPAPEAVSVSVEGWVPGFERGELQPFIARQMNNAGLAGWHFVPAADNAAAAPDRVEWRFKPNPYAGGPAYHRTGMMREIDKIFGTHRPVSVEIRLYRHGEYQLLESAQPTIQGGPRDADLQKEIVALTKSLESASDPGAHPKS